MLLLLFGAIQLSLVAVGRSHCSPISEMMIGGARLGSFRLTFGKQLLDVALVWQLARSGVGLRLLLLLLMVKVVLLHLVQRALLLLLNLTLVVVEMIRFHIGASLLHALEEFAIPVRCDSISLPSA